MKRHSMRLLSLVLCFLLLISIVPTTVLAAVDYNHDSAPTSDNYYQVVAKRDWNLAPGIDESEIILNNDSKTRRQVAHVMVADVSNQYVKVTTSYNNMDTSVYAVNDMYAQTTAARDLLGWNVIGGMNTCLSWYDGYPTEHKFEPLGFMMIDGETVWDLTEKYGSLGFPTCVVIYKDDRPEGMPKVKMTSITGTQDLTGYEEQVIPCSSGYIVKDGVNQTPTPNHLDDTNNSAPRSVVGVTADGKVVIMENDGRQSISIGMSMYELAEMMIDLGCEYACNCDGGGSSTFVSKRPGEELAVINSPSDGLLRDTTSGILFVSTAPADGEFARAQLTTDYNNYTPNSVVTFNAVGTDLAGNAADIPAEASWRIVEDNMGTIENGVFTSNGTTGTVTAQLTMPDDALADRTVVFSNNKGFENVKIYCWNSGTDTAVGPAWPGSDMTYYDTNEYNQDRYTFVMPEGADRFIIHNGAGNQSQNIEFNGNTTGVYLGENNEGLFYDPAKTVGEASINIMVPDTIEFEMPQMTIPYGKRVNLDMTASLNGAEIALKPADINFAFTNTIGTLDGFTFIAFDEETATENSTDVTATLVFDNNVTANASIALGKGSEVIFDFEDGIDGWEYYDYNVTLPSGHKPAQDLIYLADAENGKVRNGEHSMAVIVDNTEAQTGGWIQYRLFYRGDFFTREGAIKLGFWVWFPEEAIADEIDLGLRAYNADNAVVGNAKEVCNPDFAANEQEEAGWHYFTLNIPAAYVGMLFGENTEYNNNTFYFQFYNYNQQWKKDSEMKIKNDQGKFTYFIDDITLEYSTAADDTNPPIFSNFSYAGSGDSHALNNDAALTESNLSFTANVAEDNTLTTAVGLNADSCKAFIDGNEIPVTFNRGLLYTDSYTLNDGEHTVKFYAEDNNGNPASTVRTFTVNAGTDIPTITLQPTDPDKTDLLLGSIYSYDIVASDISAVQSVTMEIDLNNSSTWELDQMTVAPGFTASYEVRDYDNVAIITINREGSNGRSSVLATLPLRVFYSNEETISHAKRVWVTAKTKQGLLTTTDGDSVFFLSSPLETATEMGQGEFDPGYVANYAPHKHTAEPVADKPATCNEDGYTGRTYCAVCDSVVDWGTVVPATGHQYEFVEGVLKCTTCGEIFNGVYDVDGKYYVDGVAAEGWQTIDGKQYYFIDGVKNTEDLILDNHLYTFDENGVYDENYSHTGPYYEEAAGKWRYFDHSDAYKGWVVYDNHSYFYNSDYYAATGVETMGGRDYKFEGVQGKCIGAWVEEAGGKRFYYGLKYYKYTWAEIEGETYYFDNNGHVLTGKVAISHNGAYIGAHEFDEDGKLVGNITGVFQDLRTGYYYYAEDGVLFNGGLLKWNDNYYFARSNHLLATSEWYVPADKTNNLKAAGTYVFAEDGKMVVEEGVIKGDDGIYRYYVDGVQQYGLGLIKVDDDYYYVRSNGTLATYEWYVGRNDLGINPGTYQFGEDGKMIVANGVIQGEDGIYRYYLNGVQQYGLGLIKVGDDYYYVRSNGKICTTDWYVGANDYGFPAGSYSFGEDGKMIILNGIVKVGDNLKYYVNGKAQSGLGLIEIDGDYYYVRSNGNLATSDWYVGENDYGIPKGSYRFGEDGKMVLLNGIIDVGGLKYYVDNEQQYGLGLIQYEGDFYYVRSNGNVITDSDYYIGRNDFGVSVGTHHFGPDGKMTDADI